MRNPVCPAHKWKWRFCLSGDASSWVVRIPVNKKKKFFFLLLSSSVLSTPALNWTLPKIYAFFQLLRLGMAKPTSANMLFGILEYPNFYYAQQFCFCNTLNFFNLVKEHFANRHSTILLTIFWPLLCKNTLPERYSASFLRDSVVHMKDCIPVKTRH